MAETAADASDLSNKRKRTDNDEEEEEKPAKSLKLIALEELQAKLQEQTMEGNHHFNSTVLQGNFSRSMAFVIAFITEMDPSRTSDVFIKLWSMWANVMILVDKSNQRRYSMIRWDFGKSLASDLLREVGIYDGEGETVLPDAQDMPAHYEGLYASIAQALQLLFTEAVFPSRFEKQMTIAMLDVIVIKVRNETMGARRLQGKEDLKQQLMDLYCKHLGRFYDQISLELEGFACPLPLAHFF